MADAVRHRKSDIAHWTHIGQGAANIASVGFQLGGVGHLFGTVEEVVDPMRGVSEIGLGLNLIPSIARHNAEDESVNFYLVVGVNGTGNQAELFEESGMRQ